MNESVPYSPERFDEGYYCRGERNGFTNYEYDSPVQQQQLEIKWGICQAVPHRSALFVGCARGYEVVFWHRKQQPARGVDVSQWAIDHCHPEASGFVKVIDGVNLTYYPDNSFNLVCAFDVMTIPPFHIASQLASEMMRVAKYGVIVRTIVKNWRNLDIEIDGVDGTNYKYQQLETWDRVFTVTGKFALHTAMMGHQYEVVFVWKAV